MYAGVCKHITSNDMSFLDVTPALGGVRICHRRYLQLSVFLFAAIRCSATLVATTCSYSPLVAAMLAKRCENN